MFILINYCYWQCGLYLYQIMLNHNELPVFICSSYTHTKYKNKEANIACHTKLLQHSLSCWSILQKKILFVKYFNLKNMSQHMRFCRFTYLTVSSSSVMAEHYLYVHKGIIPLFRSHPNSILIHSLWSAVCTFTDKCLIIMKCLALMLSPNTL
jgi:hypothetical protein